MTVESAAPAPVAAAGSPAARAPVTPRPVAPTPAAAPAAEPVLSPEALKAERAKLADERRSLEVKMVRAQRKYAEETKAKEKTWGEKLSRLDTLEKERAQAKINKTAYLKSLYGDDWYDQVVSEKLNGGAPTADVVASEISKVREEMEAKFAEQEAKRIKADESAASRSVDTARKQLHAEGAMFLRANIKDFPVFEKLGSPADVAAMLAQRIESHYNSTLQRDESGEILVDGEVLTLKQAAEGLEAQILGLAEQAAGSEKYAERLRAKLPQPKSPAAAGGPTLQAQRRTLTNELTASTSGRTPPASDEERRERAIAAYNANRRP